jgi:hypothetical protein
MVSSGRRLDTAGIKLHARLLPPSNGMFTDPLDQITVTSSRKDRSRPGPWYQPLPKRSLPSAPTLGFFSIAWMPLLPSTNWVTRMSTARLQNM